MAETIVSVPLGTLGLAGYAPILNLVSVPSAALSLTGYAPTVTQASKILGVPVGTLTLTGYPPEVLKSELNTFTSMFISGHEPSTGAITAYLHGGHGISINSNVPLSIPGSYSVNAFLNASVTGAVFMNASTTLFENGVGTTNGIAYLSIEGWLGTMNSYTPLFLQVGTSGIHGTQASIPLHMSPPKAEDSIPLFIGNDESHVSMSESKTLFVKSDDWHSGNGSLPLYLQNDAMAQELTLWIKGDGFWPNYVPANGSISLYINRTNDVGVIPLFLKVLDNGSNTYTSLYLISYLTDSGSLTLAVPDVADDSMNSFLKMYVEGAVPATGSTTAYVFGVGEQTGSLPLTVKQGSGFPNSYTSLVVNGAYLDNGDMTLVVPGVVDNSPDDSLPMYVLGW